jgi:hypothetical protein
VAELILISWRDIPAQLLAREGRRTLRRELPPRFAEAIDRAAMRGGARDEEAYLAGWTRMPIGSVEGELEAALAERAAIIEAEYDADRLAALVESGGRA